MATTYKTPGVYVEEISKLPPSVAQVETAIPAFIGYTEKAMNIAPDDLLKKPTKIGSMVEYEFYFGTGPSPNISEVNIDDSNNFVSATVTNNFFLYDSLRMFYSNGGGDCFIVSMGNYNATPAKPDFENGIAALEKEDEPTMILFPDAVKLSAIDLGSVQAKALELCNNLQDRVGVFDVQQNDPKGANFRSSIGINYLSYGAAYTPWLKVTLPKVIKFPDVKSVIKRSGIAISLSGLTSDAAIQAIISDLDKIYVDIDNIKQKTIALSPANGNLWDKFNSLEAAFNTTGNNNNTSLVNFFDYMFDIAIQIDKYINGSAPDLITYSDLKTNVKNAVDSNFDTVYAKVVSLELEADADITDGYNPVTPDLKSQVSAGSWPDVNSAAASNIIAGTTDDERRISVVNNLKIYFDEINQAYLNLIVSSAQTYSKTLDDSLALSFPVYKTIINGASNSLSSMPPSGAVAGVYAATDRNRGVWKAPANVSLTNVSAPETTFTKTELDGLNIDAVSGKSINAIRSFYGKGTLVFGARTLAGNDNEWRYISVRRFFNMVEESSKKATEPFVFEPNDSGTWIKVQGMLENFLTILWRQGALQGVKPEHAFYVAVGLGKTMTALDILEGRMIVEIGMAVVRPAEFIILRFSHKMAES